MLEALKWKSREELSTDVVCTFQLRILDYYKPVQV